MQLSSKAVITVLLSENGMFIMRLNWVFGTYKLNGKGGGSCNSDIRSLGTEQPPMTLQPPQLKTFIQLTIYHCKQRGQAQDDTGMHRCTTVLQARVSMRVKGDTKHVLWGRKGVWSVPFQLSQGPPLHERHRWASKGTREAPFHSLP